MGTIYQAVLIASAQLDQAQEAQINGCDDSVLTISATDSSTIRDQKDAGTQICSYMNAVVQYHDKYGSNPTLPDDLSEFVGVYGKGNEQPSVQEMD